VISRGSNIEMKGLYDSKGKSTAWKEIFHITSATTFTQTLYMGTGQGAEESLDHCRREEAVILLQRDFVVVELLIEAYVLGQHDAAPDSQNGGVLL
jgi:hypothetical protein